MDINTRKALKIVADLIDTTLSLRKEEGEDELEQPYISAVAGTKVADENEEDMTIDEIKAECMLASIYMIRRTSEWAVRDTLTKLTEWNEFGPVMASIDEEYARELAHKLKDELKTSHPDWWWEELYDKVYHYAGLAHSMGLKLTAHKKQAKEWKLTIDVEADFNMLQAHCDEDDFEDERGQLLKDELVSTLRSYEVQVDQLTPETQGTYAELVQSIEDAQDIDDFDYAWNDLYDFCDALDIWLKTF